MGDGLFAIFSDSHSFLGSALKEGLHSSQKKALQDVKNTLPKHHVSVKPTGKLNMQNTFCKPGNLLLYDCNRKTAFSSISSSFEDECDSHWEYCNCCDRKDDIWHLRLPEESLHNEDHAYLSKGLFNLQTFDIDDPQDISMYPVDNDLDIIDVLGGSVCHNEHWSLDIQFPLVNPDIDLDPPTYIKLEAGD